MVHPIMNLIGLRFNCVFRMTGCCSEIDSVSLQEHKNNIYSEIRQPLPDTLRSFMETTKNLSLSCQNSHGNHSNDIIFKTKC